jgi:hypothetical protein
MSAVLHIHQGLQKSENDGFNSYPKINFDSCGKENDEAVVIVNETDVTVHTFKYRDRERLLLPYFVLQSITNTFND